MERNEDRRSRPSGSSLAGKVRNLDLPETATRTHLHAQPATQVEVALSSPGYLPSRALLPADAVSEREVARLRAGLRNLPRLAMQHGQGGVDIRLETPDGAQVKSGTVVLEGPGGRQAIAIDPTTRRFRQGSLPAGDYELSAASAGVGRATARLTVREGDVARKALSLADPIVDQPMSLRLAIRGSSVERVHVTATDKFTGKTVFKDTVAPVDGIATIMVSAGKLHLEIVGGGAKSCYDVDADDFDLVASIPPLLVEMEPPIPKPDPPWGQWLPDALRSTTFALAGIGIRSTAELAAAEPERLMHLAKSRKVPIPSRMIAAAIEAARQHEGIATTAGEVQSTFRLAPGAAFERAFRIGERAEVAFDVDLGAEGRGELTIDGPGGVRRFAISGRERVAFVPAAAEFETGAVYRMSLRNVSEQTSGVSLVAELPAYHGEFVTIPVRTVQQRIESIMAALAVTNPGLATTMGAAVLAPENIRMWIDHARTMMHEVGVCSIDDLGKLRLNPLQILRAGAYIAPAKPPQPNTVVTALQNYAFAEIINGSVLYYQPNKILHDTAIILASEWDIRGQTIVIGSDVRELLVIAHSIGHDAGSRITWELPVLPNAHEYWPNVAGNGAHGNNWGESGQPGDDGDQSPSPSKNGGASAVTEGPIVTMWLLDTTGNLPPIDLRGQGGRDGGRGQDAGNGGNGHEGLRADGTFFGGCCREAGFGGNGGNGGRGGKGGKGGNGGVGGKLTLLTTPPGIIVMEAATPFIDVNEGGAGAGGTPGNGGSPGIGGPAGTADCEIWCDERPGRRGSDGSPGAAGAFGDAGNPGPAKPSDAIQILAITQQQWDEAFNNPHILSAHPLEAEPGQTVTLNGLHFDPALDRVFFDGIDVGPVSSATTAAFAVPLDSEGGYHPAVIRPPGASKRRSNKVQIKVLPKLDAIAANTRWNEGQAVTLTGLAFRPGCQLIAEDWSVSPHVSFFLPTTSVTRTKIELTIANAPLVNLRGVRRILVRNPDGGTTRDERVARIGDTIIVRCAAFRLVGDATGVTTAHSAAQIAGLFAEGAPGSLSIPWGQARIVFQLVNAPVPDVVVPEGVAFLWPHEDAGDDFQDAFATAGYVPGALNLFFVRDTEDSTAYAWYGGGPLAIGDEPDMSYGTLGAVDFMQVVAHEIGHALCLRHVCDAGDDPDGGFLGHACQESDQGLLMYPHWNVSDSMDLPAGQIDQARVGATSFETGKVGGLALNSLFQGHTPPSPQCATADMQN